MHNGCECSVCKGYRLFCKNIEGLDEERQEYFKTLYSILTDTEDDLCYYRGIVEGDFEDSDDMIVRIRRAVAKRKEN